MTRKNLAWTAFWALSLLLVMACSSPLGGGPGATTANETALARSIVTPILGEAKTFTYYTYNKKGDATQHTARLDGNITSLSEINPATASVTADGTIVGTPWVVGAGSAPDSAVQEIDTGALGIGQFTEGQKLGPLTITKIYWKGSEQVGIDFTSELPVIALAMKGSDAYNVFLYDAPGATSDTWVYTPVNASGTNSAISHMVFAWKPQVLMDATALPAFDRDWNWSIAKANDVNVGVTTPNSAAYPQMIDPGKSWTVNYSVTGGATFVDHDFRVSGLVTVSNPAYNKTNAVIAGLSDLIGGSIAATVEGSFPVTILPGGSATFAYSTALPDNSAFHSLWTATEAAGSLAIGNSLEGDTSFGSMPANETDTSITISDSLEPSAGRIISLPAGQASAYSYGFGYAHVIDSAAAGDGSAAVAIRNVASFVSSGNGDQGSAYSDVWVKLHLASVGYVRSQGYWKTHANSANQNHPLFDPTWDLLGVASPFFLSGKGNIDVMWTAPQGNVYYNLASQYVGARLNVLTGYPAASSVTNAIARAEYYFRLYTPAQTGAWKSSDAKRQEMTSLAGVLGAFNSLEK